MFDVEVFLNLISVIVTENEKVFSKVVVIKTAMVSHNNANNQLTRPS